MFIWEREERGEKERGRVWKEEGEKEEGKKKIEENKLSGISKGTNPTRKSPPS